MACLMLSPRHSTDTNSDQREMTARHAQTCTRAVLKNVAAVMARTSARGDRQTFIHDNIYNRSASGGDLRTPSICYKICDETLGHGLLLTPRWHKGHDERSRVKDQRSRIQDQPSRQS
jgi:hypothetical protein